MTQDTAGWSRRDMMRMGGAAVAAGGMALPPTGAMAQAAGQTGARSRATISNLQTMELQGPKRTYVFLKITTNDGQFGIAEGYGVPYISLRQEVEAIKPSLIGRDPLEIDMIYTFLGEGSAALSGTRTDGSAHNQMRLASVVDMALWDLAGKMLGVPTTVLLGGKFRDRVQVYDHSGPANMLDKGSCRAWAEKANAHPSGFFAHKMGIPRTEFASGGGPSDSKGMLDQAHDRSNRQLTTKELVMIGKSFENAREAIGWEHDIMIHSHWEFDLESSIQLAKILEPIKPRWFEDPLQVDYTDSWKRLVAESPIPILTGENLVRRQGFLPFLTNGAIDIVQPDLRNSGGFTESRKIADLASVYGIPVCTHNTGSPLSTVQTCQWAGSIRDYLMCETSTGDGGWIDDVLIHDGKYIDKGYIKITDKPGLGVTLNRQVIEPRLVPGSTWWGD